MTLTLVIIHTAAVGIHLWAAYSAFDTARWWNNRYTETGSHFSTFGKANTEHAYENQRMMWINIVLVAFNIGAAVWNFTRL